MPINRIHRRPRRTVAVVVGVALAASAAAVVAALPVSAAQAQRLTAQRDASVPGRQVAPDMTVRTLKHDGLVPAPVWPAPGAVELAVGGAGTAKARAGSLPVTVGAPGSFMNSAPGSPVSKARVEVLDRAATASSGVDGVLLKVQRADGLNTPGRVALSVDYGGFRYAYGAGWASRLRLVALSGGSVAAARNDMAAGRISADVDLAGAGEVMLAVTGGTSSGDGTYQATPLKPSSTWSVGGSTGDFSWSYPMRMPPSLGGPAPELTLSYSSSSVDGRTVAANSQPSIVGEGLEPRPERDQLRPVAYRFP